MLLIDSNKQALIELDNS